MRSKTVQYILTGLLTVTIIAGCAGPENPPVKQNSEKSVQAEKTTEFDLPPHHFIHRGMSTSRITSLVGSPERTLEKSGRPDVWYYEFGVVMVADGQVQYKFPPSRSNKAQQAKSLETGP